MTNSFLDTSLNASLLPFISKPKIFTLKKKRENALTAVKRVARDINFFYSNNNNKKKKKTKKLSLGGGSPTTCNKNRYELEKKVLRR